MKITDLKSTFVEIPFPETFYPTWRPAGEKGQGAVIVEVFTDEGVTGIGGMEAHWGWERKVLVARVELMITPSFLVESLQGTLMEPLKIDKDGYVHVPPKPGLGIELNREAIERFKVASGY
jgi:L-alanine-DL-glutamate epimerase-like enolase superfamily enzyme